MLRHALVSWLLFAATLLPAQSPPSTSSQLPGAPAPLPPTEFAARRAALLQAIRAQEPDGPFVVLLRGAATPSDMGTFVQDQDFLYLSGIAEPGLALLFVAAAPGEADLDELLVPPFSRFAATWDGNFLWPGEATAQRTGFKTAGNVRALAERLDALLAIKDGKRPLLYTLTEPAARTGSTPRKAAAVTTGVRDDALDGRQGREQRLVERLRAKYEGLVIKSLEPHVHRLRQHKSLAEQALLRRATEVAAAGIAEAMRSARPGVFEFQLAATARFVFGLHGAGPDAYAAIVGGGPNGCILHYNLCTRQLEPDDLIVMDYAPTLHGYASDVTRTFPASGKFSEAQRKLVQDVYEIQQALLALVKPGASLSAIDGRCSELLRERGYIRDHGPCHHVGLAVHDPSIDVLQAGMVITVEPGAYLRQQGMGCRIEDTVLVTADGHENLSGHLPASPDAIEALMREKGLLDVPMAGHKPDQR